VVGGAFAELTAEATDDELAGVHQRRAVVSRFDVDGWLRGAIVRCRCWV
jgi:hypothetical protein